MKEKFLALVEQTKNTGIAATLAETSTADELKSAWQKFKEENEQLFADVFAWADAYAKDGYNKIFSAAENIENPTEVFICIYIASCKDASIHECSVFCQDFDLIDALESVGNDFNDKLAEFISGDYVYNLTAEDLFPSDDADEEIGDDEEDSEDVEEDGDAEDSDAGR